MTIFLVDLVNFGAIVFFNVIFTEYNRNFHYKNFGKKVKNSK